MYEKLILEKLDTLMIEKVANGFILYENHSSYKDPSIRNGATTARKVFNTKDQLKEFIDENF